MSKYPCNMNPNGNADGFGKLYAGSQKEKQRKLANKTLQKKS